ncbi:AmmeMemoRadiSam system protein B, partial [Chloroflexota bacterium]
MIREPVVAGQFYPATAAPLKSILARLVNEDAEKEDVIGLVSPHAGYIYSGAVAGAVISRIEFKDTFILLGPNHTGKGKPFSIMTAGSWRTPLGKVRIDTRLARHILEKSSSLENDSVAHQSEHSLEVQLPFLQYFRPDIKIIPIILTQTSGATLQKIGMEIALAIKESGRKVVILASSDMTHYEPHDTAKEKDSKAIEAILELDENKLLKRVNELDISMCGYAPAVVLITAAKELGAKSAELVKYQTSGDTSG